MTRAILLEAVTGAGLTPSRIVLEITERSIVNLAEGIENAAMLEFVQQAELPYVQGYLLGRPNEAFPVNSDLQDLGELLYTGAH